MSTGGSPTTLQQQQAKVVRGGRGGRGGRGAGSGRGRGRGRGAAVQPSNTNSPTGKCTLFYFKSQC